MLFCSYNSFCHRHTRHFMMMMTIMMMIASKPSVVSKFCETCLGFDIIPKATAKCQLKSRFSNNKRHKTRPRHTHSLTHPDVHLFANPASKKPILVIGFCLLFSFFICDYVLQAFFLGVSNWAHIKVTKIDSVLKTPEIQILKPISKSTSPEFLIYKTCE